MKRRYFVKAGILGLGGLSLGCSQPLFLLKDSGDHLNDGAFTYLLSHKIDSTLLPLPDDMRVPFNWDSFGIHKETVKINFKKPNGQKPMPAMFRISTSIDVREQKLVEVFLPSSNKVLGVLDIRYSPVFQPFQLALTVKDVEAVFDEGIALKQTNGDNPLWLFKPGGGKETSNKGLMPHLLFNSEKEKPLDLFYTNFLSLNSVQSFGWMEGCVLDGLLDMDKRFPAKKVKPVIDNHLQLFFDEQNNLSYEGPYSRPYLNKFYGIEALLPFGAIAQLYPENPLLPAVAAYCTSKTDTTGLIRDKHITTEGCYTIAYPLAAIAVALKQGQLARMAIDQLLIRKELLVKNNIIHQKMDEKEQLSYAYWARGVSWYLLGMVRTLSIADDNKTFFQDLEKDIEIVKTEFISAANWALALQDPSGLWFCFLDKPATKIDTSGSAGIAAALAIGANRGYLPSSVKQSLKLSLNALSDHLTPDGFLSGAAQANKGGIELQENGYRVISQYASGLMAQLGANTAIK